MGLEEISVEDLPEEVEEEVEEAEPLDDMLVSIVQFFPTRKKLQKKN